MEFDFTIVVKQGKMHLRADHLSCMIHGEQPAGVKYDLPDAYLFSVEMVPRWSEDIVSLMTIGALNNVNKSI